MKDAIRKFFDAQIADYVDWHSRLNTNMGSNDSIKNQMIAEFKDRSRIEFGRKYAKIVMNGSAHSFIVMSDNDKEFKKGDVLKAASWAAPARNFPRGNVLSGNFNIRWSGQ